VKHMHFFLKILKDEISTFRRADVFLLLKFKHYDLTIGGVSHPEILE
jgi:hypothetical protein